MYMLTKRTNILFEEELWDKLVKLSKIKEISVSSIIRQAIEEKFNQQDLLEKRRKAVEATLKHRPQPFKGKINYKELINAGRRVY